MRKYTYCGFLSILLLMGCASAPTESEVVITDSITIDTTIVKDSIKVVDTIK